MMKSIQRRRSGIMPLGVLILADYYSLFLLYVGIKKVVLSNLKPSIKIISLRLPEPMLEELKLLANKRDMPYQSLLKIFLAEQIEEELETKKG